MITCTYKEIGKLIGISIFTTYTNYYIKRNIFNYEATTHFVLSNALVLFRSFGQFVRGCIVHNSRTSTCTTQSVCDSSAKKEGALEIPSGHLFTQKG